MRRCSDSRRAPAEHPLKSCARTDSAAWTEVHTIGPKGQEPGVTNGDRWLAVFLEEVWRLGLGPTPHVPNGPHIASNTSGPAETDYAGWDRRTRSESDREKHLGPIAPSTAAPC